MPQVPAKDDLRGVEEVGSLWASRCIKDLFEEKDIEFFATRYQPIYAYLKKIEGLYQSTIGEFDPFEQYKHFRTLFAPLFGTHRAAMIRPSINTLGKVPNIKFASFEVGVIRKIRKTWEDVKRKKDPPKK